VVLRPEAIRARLLKLEEVTSRLEEINQIDRFELTRDFRNAWSAERGLQIGAETILGIGNHILSAHFGVSAEDYESIIVELGAKGVIDPSLRKRLQGLGGFRNILVHGYLRIDPECVADFLARAPQDFPDFGSAIRTWLDRVTAR